MKTFITILLLIASIVGNAQINEYVISASDTLKTLKVFQIGNHKFKSTTQVDSNDTTLVSLKFIDAIDIEDIGTNLTGFLKGNGTGVIASTSAVIAGTSTTARTTAAKTATISGYTLTAGDLLAITFTDGFSVSNATLSINGGSAINIRVGGVNLTTSLLSVAAGTSFTLPLYYDGTHFYAYGSSINTTYSEISEADITTGTASTGRTISGRRAAFIAGRNQGTATPAALGTATVGTSVLYSREDHVHPLQTSFHSIASNYFPRSNGTGGFDDTPLYSTGVNIGLNTTAMTRMLNLSGSTPAIALDIVRSSGFAAVPIFDIRMSNGTVTNQNLFYIGGYFNVNAGGTPALSYIYFGNGYLDNTLRFYADKTTAFYGSVGINGNSPSEWLDVDGNARFRAITSGTATEVLGITSTGVLTKSIAGVVIPSVKIGATSNHTLFAADGTITLVGDATVFKEVSNQLASALTKSDDTLIVVNLAECALDFKNNTTPEDYAIVNLQLPHDWKIGSNVLINLHWWQNENKNPNWVIEYRWQKLNSTKITSWTNVTLFGNQHIYPGSGVFHQKSTFTAITPPSGANMSDIIQIRLIRDTANSRSQYAGADTYTGNAESISLDLHYESDALGSKQEYIK
jgi:hypothetical protein